MILTVKRDNGVEWIPTNQKWPCKQQEWQDGYSEFRQSHYIISWVNVSGQAQACPSVTVG